MSEDDLAQHGYMVAAAAQIAGSADLVIRVFAVGCGTAEACSTKVRAHPGVEAGATVKVGKKLSDGEIWGLNLRPEEVVQYV
jgi:hypothetical protein